MTENSNQDDMKYQILVVDDDELIRDFYITILSPLYEVLAASSGDEAIEICRNNEPELVLLDIEMPGLNGYETCKRLREFSAVPIVFATALMTLEEHLKAFDAGGDDLMTKPLEPEIVFRKIALAISKKQEQQKLLDEKQSMHNMAMGFLTSMGENGILLNFVRSILTCRSLEDLSDKLLDACRQFSLRCFFKIHHDGRSLVRATHGEPTFLEQAILEKSGSLGRIFQLKTNMVVNYDHISMVIADLPDDQEKVGRIRDNIAILAETADVFCENLRPAIQEVIQSLDAIQNQQSQMWKDLRLLLNEQQPAALSQPAQELLTLLDKGDLMNAQFEAAIKLLKDNVVNTGSTEESPEGNKSNDIELF